VTKKLRSAVARFERDVVAGHDSEDRPFLIGHPDYRRTQLPARDGIAHGKIKRSNRFPNCSFFSNWSSLDDRITWDVEVGAEGTYHVELYYSCRAADVGATIELSLGDSKVSAKVTEAHDPPLVGAEQDRVERIESYVKEFRPLEMGSIELAAGRGELTLRALDIPGEQAIDFRLMMFTRVD
jgi:LmbE family N-acetylglucosaminyl deacetylase